MPAQAPDSRESEAHVSAALHAENVAQLVGDAELREVVSRGPRGALALAGLTVGILMAIWLAFFVFIFLPRGAVG